MKVPGFTRRMFLTTMLGAAVAPLIDCRCRCDEARLPASSPLSLGGDGVPHIVFEPLRTHPQPSLPPGASPDITAAQVRTALSYGLSDYLTWVKRTGNISAARPDRLLRRCANIFVDVHPSFYSYIKERMPAYRKNPHSFAAYINRFLLLGGQHLFIRYGGRAMGDLFDVSRSFTVRVDGIDRAAMHFLEGGVLGTHIAGGELGSTTSGNKREIVMFPQRADAAVASIRRYRTWRSPYGLRESLIQGAMYHEGIHILVQQRYGMVDKLFPVDLSRHRIDIGGLLVFIDGSYSYEQLHELCATGGELAVARDASQPILFLRGEGNNASLAQLTLQYFMLKHMSYTNALKREHLARMRPPYASINTGALARYFDRHDDVQLVHRIGRDMYRLGMDVFNNLYRRMSG